MLLQKVQRAAVSFERRTKYSGRHAEIEGLEPFAQGYCPAQDAQFNDLAVALQLGDLVVAGQFTDLVVAAHRTCMLTAVLRAG